MANETRTQEIYRHLKNLIVSSQLLAGTPLFEQELGEKLNVSRTPIREALRILENEGLVEIEARRGARVARISIDDVKAAYEIREWVETKAAAKAVTLADRAVLDKLKAAVERMPSEPKTHEEAVQAESADREFHDTIIDASNNAVVKKILNECRAVTSRAAYFVPPGRHSQSKQEHRDILKAFTDCKPDEAERLMLKHIRAAANRRFGFDGILTPSKDTSHRTLDRLTFVPENDKR